MKRGWAALVMILAVIALGMIESFYINTNTRTCLSMLDEADALMEQSEVREAHSVAARLDNRYESQAPVYDIFLFHNEVTDIRSGLAALRRYAQTGDISEFLATSARIRRALEYMRLSLLPKPENIL